MWGPLGGGGAPGQGRQPLRIEGVEDVADRLIVASQRLANHAGCLAPGTGEQDLTATYDKGIGRLQALLQGLLFARGQQADINGFSHAQQYTTFPNTLRETALGTDVLCNNRRSPLRRPLLNPVCIVQATQDWPDDHPSIPHELLDDLGSKTFQIL